MTRLTAAFIACAALLSAGAASAQRGPPFSVAPTTGQLQASPSEPSAPAPRRSSYSGGMWTDPGNTFSFDKPRAWKDVDTASMPGAERLEIVSGDEDGQCWFTRVPRERTKTMTPKQLIEARAQPISADLWSRIAINHPLLVGVVQVVDHSVEYRGSWPIQIARLEGRGGEVYAAIHSRPGLDITVFCAAKHGANRTELLNEIARSVTTPRDAQLQTQIY